MKGNGMKMTKKNVAVRAAVATLLSVGLSAGAIGIASASPRGDHARHASTWTVRTTHEGVVTGYVAGSSISVQTDDSTTSTTYVLTSATTITGLAAGASLLNSKVVLTLSTTTPATVLSIKVEMNGSKCNKGNGSSKANVNAASGRGSSDHDHDHGDGNSSTHGNFRK